MRLWRDSLTSIELTEMAIVGRCGSRPVAPFNTKRLAKIMKALASEHCLALYLGIAENSASGFEAPTCHVSQIVKAFRLTPPTICHHLKELANADLIVTERQGKYLVAKVNKDALAEVEEVLALVKSG